MSARPAISQQIATQHLPVFAHTVKAFRPALSASVLNWKVVGNIILKDPGLVLQTIQLLQSGARRASSLEVTNMSQAVMLMGMDRVKYLLRGLPVLETSLSRPSQAGYTRAVNRALHAAFQARNWAQWRNDYAPEEVYIATLLHCLPELVLWISEPEKMHQLRRRVYRDGMSPDEAHHITLGQSLQHFGRQITADLHLPAFVQDVLRPENASIPRVQGVLLAVQLANIVEFGWYREEVAYLLHDIALLINKTEDETTKIVHQNALHVAHDMPVYDIDSPVIPAAALMALIPSNDNGLILEEFPDEGGAVTQATSRTDSDSSLRQPGRQAKTDVGADTTVSARRVTGSITVEERAKTPRATSEASPTACPAMGQVVCLSPQSIIFARTVKQLEAGIGKLDTDQIFRIVVHGMREGIGLHRVVYAAKMATRPYLEAQCMAGTDNDPVFNQFRIKLDNINLFSRLLEKPTGVWINDENRSRYWNSVPDDFKVLVKINSFCAMSVFAGSKPLGLFYADRHVQECKIDKHAFSLFRHLGLLASKCLAASPKPDK